MGRANRSAAYVSVSCHTLDEMGLIAYEHDPNLPRFAPCHTLKAQIHLPT